MIADKDKCICHSKGTEAGRKGDLRSFIHDTVIEFSPKEEWATRQL
jgi:hypothetical protein